MAPVMVVRIVDPTVDLKGDFVLKVYDHRYTNDLRKRHEIYRWSNTRDIELEKRCW
jgi:hypothetical protein